MGDSVPFTPCGRFTLHAAKPISAPRYHKAFLRCCAKETATIAAVRRCGFSCAKNALSGAATIERRPTASGGNRHAIGPVQPGIRLSYSLSIDALCRGLGPKITRLMLFQMPISPGRTSPLGHTRIGRLHPNRQLAASGRREREQA
jgi:hypothetical protein